MSILLAESTGFAPIVNLQPRNDRVLRQRTWIEQPAVGNDVLQFQKIFLAQLPSPKFAKRLQPEKREPHFLFQKRFDWWGDLDLSLGRSAERLVDIRNIRQIKKFEESINVAAWLRLIVLGGDNAPGCGRCGMLDAGCWIFRRRVVFFIQHRGSSI